MAVEVGKLHVIAVKASQRVEATTERQQFDTEMVQTRKGQQQQQQQQIVDVENNCLRKQFQPKVHLLAFNHITWTL